MVKILLFENSFNIKMQKYIPTKINIRKTIKKTLCYTHFLIKNKYIELKEKNYIIHTHC